MRKVELKYWYARQKFSAALELLATHEGKVNERLLAAAKEIILVGDEQTPPDQRAEVAAIKAELARRADKDADQGKIVATLQTMRSAKARALAQRIFEMALELRRD